MNEECKKNGHDKHTLFYETFPNGARVRHWICKRCHTCDYEPA